MTTRVFEVFCLKVWRLCNINASLLLIFVLEAKFLKGNNSTAHRRNTRRRSRRSARKNAGRDGACWRSLVLVAFPVARLCRGDEVGGCSRHGSHDGV
jgi:hypothetical protein